MQRCVCGSLLGSVCGSRRSSPSWGITSLNHCFVTYRHWKHIFFLLSTQLPTERSSSSQKAQRLTCVLFSWSQCVSTFSMLSKSKTSCCMSSPFLPLPKLILVSLLATLNKLLPFSFPVLPLMFHVVDFLCLIATRHSGVHLCFSLWAQEVQYFSFPPLSSSSFISLFFYSEYRMAVNDPCVKPRWPLFLHSLFCIWCNEL